MQNKAKQSSSERAKRSDRSRQLRGRVLEVRIESVIRELAADAQEDGKEYVYNASAVARRVPTTRKTLARHDAFVSRVIEDLAARRRMATGAVGLEQLRDQVARLKEEIAERDNIIHALRAHHVEIYTRFHGHSLQGETLIRPILEAECDEAGRCILCGTENYDSPAYRRGNIVQIPRKVRQRKHD